MVEFSKVNINLSNTQLNNLKTAAKNNKGTALRMDIEMFNGNDSPHELLLTARRKRKLRNANNMSAALKTTCQLIYSFLKFKYLT